MERPLLTRTGECRTAGCDLQNREVIVRARLFDARGNDVEVTGREPHTMAFPGVTCIGCGSEPTWRGQVHQAVAP